MPAHGATVQRLRVHAPGAGSAQAARAQHAVRRWLAELTPAHYGLPAQAIVVVRQVQTRLPALVPGSPWPDPLLPLLRGAARPATQPAIGAAVAAVWFSDEAELLACLARDALAARPTWWWPLLLGRQPDVALAAARWCRAPTQLPRAWLQLCVDDRAIWLQAMGRAARVELQQALRSAFAVCDAVQAWVAGDDTMLSRAWTSPAHGVPVTDASHRPETALPHGAAPPAPRLHRLLQALSTDAMAAASPAHATAWCPELTAAGAPRPANTSRSAVDTRQHSAPTLAAAVAPWPGQPVGAYAPVPPASPGTGRDRPTGAGGAAAAPVAGPSPQTPRPAADTLESTALAGTPHAESPRPAAPRRTEVIADPSTETVFETHYGGLFFLLNVALAMALYGDFTQPRTLGLAHTPWQFLCALGGRWAGPGWRGDPLSGWLRACAATQAWPRQPGTPRAGAATRSPATGTARQQQQGPQRPAPPDRLGELAPRLAQRLALALGLPRPRAAVALTLQLPARLVARPGRVDLHFALVTLPLALRLAGLDRDPGWVPAAGCDFRFHFH